MSDYGFSAEMFAGLIRAGDSSRFDVDLKDNRDLVLNKVAQIANSGELNFSRANKTRIKNQFCYSIDCYGTNLTIRYINRFLTRRMRIIMPNRDRIVRNVILSFSDATPMYVLRRDITSFYESIAIQPLKSRLLQSRSIPKKIKRYLSQYFEFFCSGEKGLPRGIAISAILAEIVMEDYDKRIKCTDGVYRYFRFSDDILVLCYNNQKLAKSISLLPEGMELNEEKGKSYHLNDTKTDTVLPVSYLGYDFICKEGKKSGKPREIIVQISERKIKRIKTKIVLSFKCFKKDGDFNLLYERIRYLSGNYRLKRTGTSTIRNSIYIKTGIYYNYNLCGTYIDTSKGKYEEKELKELDGFFHHIIDGFTKKIRRAGGVPILNKDQQDCLSRISFLKGYEKRIFMDINNDRWPVIKAAWRNV